MVPAPDGLGGDRFVGGDRAQHHLLVGVRLCLKCGARASCPPARVARSIPVLLLQGVFALRAQADRTSDALRSNTGGGLSNAT